MGSLGMDVNHCGRRGVFWVFVLSDGRPGGVMYGRCSGPAAEDLVEPVSREGCDFLPGQAARVPGQALTSRPGVELPAAQQFRTPSGLGGRHGQK
jgi:hypothetical protein